MHASKSPLQPSSLWITAAVMAVTVAACGSSNKASTPTPAGTASPTPTPSTATNDTNSSTPTKPTCSLTGGTQYTQETTVVDQNACSHMMFAKYQMGVFGAVNANIVAAAADPNAVATLGDSFQTQIVDKGSARITTFTDNLAAFLINAYGESTDPNFVAYTGPTIPNAHAALNITTAQYEAFLTDVVVPALAGADPNDVTNCFAPVLLDPNFKVQVIACE